MGRIKKNLLYATYKFQQELFPLTLSTWSRHVSLSSIMTPRCLHSIFFLLNLSKLLLFFMVKR